ncbi:hypothetical protein HOK68_03460 [Candidatus Woesearchaeota archaeon]|jgi:hypothetical protein|nr:hypothetical protein [Candidatus Woesearchaeota archaeon]MBT4387402.1 hypothetical protein [Candidatus Woesearchaeota archaeon]MBT4595779.1 hypothetical protein [Candidatus Woesearchaeota archaeon]MBT5741372.1 hypothetical protein [Candidatus Woesearchaeota archaeon]MBT6505811.1 hypothetical protein [Candidatus Woesearchaeota archaeon]
METGSTSEQYKKKYKSSPLMNYLFFLSLGLFVNFAIYSIKIQNEISISHIKNDSKLELLLKEVEKEKFVSVLDNSYQMINSPLTSTSDINFQLKKAYLLCPRKEKTQLKEIIKDYMSEYDSKENTKKLHFFISDLKKKYDLN